MSNKLHIAINLHDAETDALNTTNIVDRKIHEVRDASGNIYQRLILISGRGYNIWKDALNFLMEGK